MSISLSSISFEHKNIEYTADLLKLSWKMEIRAFQASETDSFRHKIAQAATEGKKMPSRRTAFFKACLFPPLLGLI
jgi:hypothetical protein